jgi:hypothetical protein
LHLPGLFDDSVCGVDGSLTGTGIALVKDGCVYLSTVEPKKRRGEERYQFIRESIDDALTSVYAGGTLPRASLPTLCAMESYMGGSKFTNNLFQIGKLHGIVHNNLYRMGISRIDVAPSQLKKYFGARCRNGDKYDVLRGILREYLSNIDGCDAEYVREWILGSDMHKHPVLDHNQGDALGLAIIGQHYLWSLKQSPCVESLSKTRREILAKLPYEAGQN